MFVSVNIILCYRQKKNKVNKMLILVEYQVVTKNCSLHPHLAIPMLQIAIEHLKLSCTFSEGSIFSSLASHDD